jgi:hypothetical protein
MRLKDKRGTYRGQYKKLFTAVIYTNASKFDIH